jgi:hypothetical protein
MAAHNQTKDGNGRPQDLYPAATIATDTTTTSTAYLLPVHANQVIALSTVSSRTDGTYTTTIEHSADGSNWHTWEAGSAQSANGTVQIHTTDAKPILPYVRASILSASTTSGATVAVELYFGNQR